MCPIRRLILALPHSDYLRLFDAFSSADIRCRSSKTAARMQNLDLDHLGINIAPPSLSTEESWLDGACQRTVVRSLLNAAWPWIRGQPVKITG